MDFAPSVQVGENTFVANASAHVALDGKDAMVQLLVHFLEI